MFKNQSFTFAIHFALRSAGVAAALVLPTAQGQAAPSQGQAQQPVNTVVYRCPDNLYTDDQRVAKEKGCKAVTDASVTVIGSSRPLASVAPSGTAPRSGASGASAEQPRSSSVDPKQRERESDRRRILTGELSSLEGRLASLKKDFNNGEPERIGEETRNNQKYIDRVGQMRSDISRTEADIAALKREISNLKD